MKNLQKRESYGIPDLAANFNCKNINLLSKTEHKLHVNLPNLIFEKLDRNPANWQEFDSSLNFIFITVMR